MKKLNVNFLTLSIILCLAIDTIMAQAPDIEWQKTLGGSLTDRAEFIEQTTDGGYITAGYSNSNDVDASGNHGGLDFWIVKLNQMGNLEWQKSHGGSNDDVATSLQQTIDDGYIIAGASKSSNGNVLNNRGGFDYWVMRLDETGAFDGQT
ncbi:MAG TPA: T9SS C-terminal target domain-containing protein, partial [Flavobacteriaceae bacterium]|nr:T9SS C-terminal target domain-containing protein [Flavobacteriaceae bacterium]